MGISRNKFLSAANIYSAGKFVQTDYYKGKEQDDYIETLVVLFKSKNIRTSQSLFPDESLKQLLLSIHLQLY